MRPPVFDPSPQGSVGWLKARIGHLTASRMEDATAFKRGGDETQARYKYKMDVVAERLTDSMAEHFVNKAMKHGSFWEATARKAYEVETGNLVKECGFAAHGEINYYGASSDGLIGADGMVEIKCPTAETFVQWLSCEEMPEKYKPQMTSQCSVLQRKWCDFVAYFPSVSDVEDLENPELADIFGTRTMPNGMNIKAWRFEPTAEELAASDEGAIKFLNEVDAIFDAFVRR